MSLNQAMEAARAAAANLPATQDQTGTAVADTGAMSFGTSLDDFLSGGMQVDKWLQVKDGGFRLDRNDKAFIDEFEADLDVSSVQLFVGVRAEFAGNNVQYAKSFDGGRTTSRGENFAVVARHFKENSLKPADPYRGADMTLILTSDVTQGKATIPAKTRVGYTTPVTGFAPLQALLKQLTAEGLASDAGGGRLSGPRVRVRCTHEVKTNNSGQDYGVLHFEYLGPSDAE